ncbi:MAG: hypothetical protein ABI625_20410, partial [bacterium]
MMRRLIALVAFLPVAAPTLHAQSDSLDSRLVALTYHKVSGDPLDYRAAAERTDAMRAASAFDRPDVLKVQTAQLERDVAAADPRHEFFVRVDDNISQYDHTKGEFSVMLFQPGYHVPLQVLGQQYKLVFANADAARAIPMPKEQARAFDAKLAAGGRYVSNEIRFRVTGQGDPAGATTGPRVIRAEITSVRLLDRGGAVVWTPTLVASTAATPAATTTIDIARTDVAGMHVGVKGRDLEVTLARMFGPVSKRARGNNWYAGFSSALFVNEMRCMEMPDGRRSPPPGTVCVSA